MVSPSPFQQYFDMLYVFNQTVTVVGLSVVQVFPYFNLENLSPFNAMVITNVIDCQY